MLFRSSLFAFNRKGKEGGYAEFDDFTVEEPLADRSGNIPTGKTICVTNLANGHRMQAHDRRMVLSVWQGDPDYESDNCRFLVHDRGNGKVVLEAANGKGFVSVYGRGLSGDLRLSPCETDDCLFMWQDMLHNQFMLLSLKTNRYVGLDPRSGEPYAADWPGTSAGRRGGTVFEWSEKSSALATPR